MVFYLAEEIYGCHLDVLCKRDNSTVPKFVVKCIDAIEKRGKQDLVDVLENLSFVYMRFSSGSDFKLSLLSFSGSFFYLCLNIVHRIQVSESGR